MENLATENRGKQLSEKLFKAINDNNHEEMMRLVDSGAPLENLMNRATKRTPLLYSIYENNYTAAKYLLGKGANVHARDFRQHTALHIASGFGKQNEFVELLLNYGADINAQDKEGATPLMIAAGYGVPEINDLASVRLLLSRGADMTIASNDGKTIADIIENYAALEINMAIVSTVRSYKEQKQLEREIVNATNDSCHGLKF